MIDPRLNDPNYHDPPLTTSRRERAVDRTWAWIAGIAALALIGFIVAAGRDSGTGTASNTPPPATTGQAPPAAPSGNR